MRLRTGGFAAVLAGFCVVLASCGQQPPGTELQAAAQRPQSQETASDPGVNWANQYCGAVVGLLDTMATMPRIDPGSAESAANTTSAMLGSLSGGLERTLSNLGGLGRSPLPGGDEARQTAVETYSGIRARVDQAKQQLDSAGPGTEAGQQAISAAGKALEDIGQADLLSGFASSPPLLEASRQAPSCGSLTVDGSPTPRLEQPRPTA